MKTMASGDLFAGTAHALPGQPFRGVQHVRQALHGQHAGVRRDALGNLGNRGVRHAGLSREQPMRALGLVQAAQYVIQEGFMYGCHETHISHIWTAAQRPPVDRPLSDNPPMKMRELAARNLSRLMNATGLNTLQKVADKSGVGYGTVRRVKCADVSVTVENLSSIAAAFGLTLIEFLEDYDMTPAERTRRDAAKMLAELPAEEQLRIIDYITMRAEMAAVTQNEQRDTPVPRLSRPT